MHRYKLKLNVDNLDEMTAKDKKVMKYHEYDRCDIYLWQGNLCISSDYAQHLIDTIKGKTFNKIEVIKDLEEALNYKDCIGYQHLGLKKELNR
tara:strand:- start:700 stop:978 length:279 start_codon:yes stop_codon:yes gene_type:complete